MPRPSLLRCAVLALGLALVPAVAVAAPAPDVDGAVSVSGIVTDAATGDPVGDVCVSTRRARDRYAIWEEQTCTGADGLFSFGLQPGRYNVQYDPISDIHGMQWWPQADTPADAGSIVVRRGIPVDDVNAPLLAGATLTGRAIEGATGLPMEDVCVMVSAASVEDRIAYDFNLPGNRFSFTGLPAGEVTVVIQRCDNWHRLTWAYDALTIEEATTFDLTPGETTDVGRVELLEGAVLTGQVTARGSGEPIKGIDVADQQNIRSGEPTAFRAWTDEDGRFAIEDVQPGTWLPVAYQWPHGRWAFGWRDGARDPRHAEPTVLEPGGSAVVNFQLDRAATLVGTLEGYDESIGVEARLRPFGGEPTRQTVGISWDYDAERGTFVVHGLPATKVHISFNDYSGELGQFWFDGVRDVEDATLVKLRPGRTTNVTAHLPD